MKARKNGETDAQYIARLEQRNYSLKRDNDALARQHDVFVSRARPAAMFAGAVLHAAAEVCGMRDDPRVESSQAALEALASLPWSKDFPTPVTYPTFSMPDPAANGADSEMLLQSAYELLSDQVAHAYDWFTLTEKLDQKRRDVVHQLLRGMMDLATVNLTEQARAAANIPERIKPTLPKVETLEQARTLIETVWFEVADRLSDLAISRAMLRLDLRSAMYASTLSDIADIMRQADRAVSELPLPAMEDDDEMVPF